MSGLALARQQFLDIYVRDDVFTRSSWRVHLVFRRDIHKKSFLLRSSEQKGLSLSFWDFVKSDQSIRFETVWLIWLDPNECVQVSSILMMGMSKTEINLRRLLSAAPNQQNQSKLMHVRLSLSFWYSSILFSCLIINLS